eukprot:745607-Hanusia_phi.AAC.1
MFDRKRAERGNGDEEGSRGSGGMPRGGGTRGLPADTHDRFFSPAPAPSLALPDGVGDPRLLSVTAMCHGVGNSPTFRL